MADRFRHAGHVFRVGAVLGVVLVAFLIARWAAIPSDFGVLGYYRAGALDDNRALPLVYAGRTACMECHDGTYDPPEPDAAAAVSIAALQTPLDPARDNKHFNVNCEACHGPLQTHVDDQEKAVPKVASDSLCLGCHRTLDGRPSFQPQIIPSEHRKNDDKKKEGCVSCHKPHWPKTEEPSGMTTSKDK
jgi:predicted CXXCH cytochrome family protein